MVGCSHRLALRSYLRHPPYSGTHANPLHPGIYHEPPGWQKTYSKMSCPEQLNVVCDRLAKYAHTALQPYSSLRPPLTLPFERDSMWHGDLINYIHIIIVSSHHSVRGHRPENIITASFQAVQSAMKRATPATSKWIAKMSSGFIGLASTLAKREYWQDNHCPRC